MSVHEPLSGKRSISIDQHATSKRHHSDQKDQIPSSIYSLYVKLALEAVEKNDNSQMISLASKLLLPLAHADAISPNNLTVILRSLLANMSRLENGACQALLGAVLNFEWLEATKGQPENSLAFIEAYAQFLTVLVLSYPKYLHEVLRKIVSEFSEIDNTTTYPHHQVLRRLVRFFPTSVSSVVPTLSLSIPHHISSSVPELTNFIKNAIEIVDYCPELQYSIWQMILESCIKLDVELQNEIDDLDDDSIEELLNGDDDEIEEADSSNGEIIGVSLTANIRRLVAKLDCVLDVLLQKSANAFTLGDEVQGIRLFNTLSSLFKTHILPTHFTKSVQFLIFNIAQRLPQLADAYLVLLTDIAFNTSEILEIRLKALQYLSSFIARAKNLTKHQIVFIVSFLVEWIDKYITERESEVLNNNNNINNSRPKGGMERFKLFYAAFQALLYIFCFKHLHLSVQAEDGTDGEWECNLDKFFQRAIIAKFNPLKYCDETVVFIFAKISTKLNVCYCYSIIEHNKRERMIQSNSNLPSSIGNFEHKQEFLDLEAYFPFDPLVLPTCKSIISPTFVEWKDVNPNNDDEEAEDSGSLDDDDDDSDDDDDDDEDDVDSDDDDDDDEDVDVIGDNGLASEDSGDESD